MSSSIYFPPTPGASLAYPLQQPPSPPEPGDLLVPGAKACYQSIATTKAIPLSAARVSPGPANPQIATDAEKVSQAIKPAVFFVGDSPGPRSLRLAHRQEPRHRVPTPPPHLRGDIFYRRAEDHPIFQPKRNTGF